MAYRDYHPLPYNSKIEEAIIGSFSWGQLLWLAPAAFISFQLTKLPPLPFDSWLYSRFYVAIPIVIAFIFIKVKHPKTNLTLSKYLLLMLKFKYFKKKKFLYQRENLTKFHRQQGVSEDGEN